MFFLCWCHFVVTHPCIVHSVWPYKMIWNVRYTKWFVEKIDEQMTDKLGHSAPTYFFCWIHRVFPSGLGCQNHPHRQCLCRQYDGSIDGCCKPPDWWQWWRSWKNDTPQRLTRNLRLDFCHVDVCKKTPDLPVPEKHLEPRLQLPDILACLGAKGSKYIL